VRDGVVAALPLVLCGSLFLLIAQPPVPALARIVEPWKAILLAPVKLLNGAVAIYVAFATAQALATRLGVEPRAPALTAVAGLLLCAGTRPLPGGALAVPLERLGAGGIFLAIAIALLSAHVQRAVIARRWVLRLSDHAPEAAIRAFEGLTPTVMTLGLLFVVTGVLGVDLHAGMSRLVGPMIHAGDSFTAIVVIVLIDSLLWLIGVHPVAVLALAKPVWLEMYRRNADAVASGLAPPHIGTKETFLWFIWIGGSGLTLPLAALLWRARSQQLRSVARVGLVPAIFNINDAYLFGVPIVLSGALAVPFVLAPLAAAVSTVVALKSGWVTPPFRDILWTLPGPVGAVLSTNDWRAAVLCCFNLLMAAAIYYPFVRRYDRRLAARELETDRS
jgi:PTS system cellobiose-specific IIC component